MKTAIFSKTAGRSVELGHQVLFVIACALSLLLANQANAQQAYPETYQPPPSTQSPGYQTPAYQTLGQTPSGEYCPPGYQTVQRTVYDQTPVKVKMQVNETVYDKQTVTTQRPVWTTETRQRTRTTLKPVVRTSEKLERTVVQRPVQETVLVDQVVNETVMDTVTELQNQQFIVDTPVTETQMRQQQVVVQKPVTQQYMQTENVTALRPVTITETQLRQTNAQVDQVTLNPCGGCNRRQWLEAGYYTDPVTGQSVYRRRGFHWVREGQQYVVQRVTVPMLAPQQVQRTTLVPETIQVQKPVNVTTMQDFYETRQVPVQIETTQRRVETRKVPVERQVPRTVQVTKRVPIQTTKFVDEVITRSVPVRETVYETVTTLEDFEQPVSEWVDITREVDVPRQVPREVEVELIKNTPRVVTMRVPLDAYGNPLPVAPPAGPVNSPGPRFSDPVQAAQTIVDQEQARRANFRGAVPATGQWQTMYPPNSPAGNSTPYTYPAPANPTPLNSSPLNSSPNNSAPGTSAPATSAPSTSVPSTSGPVESMAGTTPRTQPPMASLIVQPEKELQETSSSAMNDQAVSVLDQAPATPVAPATVPAEPEFEDVTGQVTPAPAAMVQGETPISEAPIGEAPIGEAPISDPALDETSMQSPTPAETFDPQPRTELTAVWRPEIPGREGFRETMERAPVPQSRPATPAVDDNVGLPSERIDGGTSLRDRFPGATLAETPEAADTAPQLGNGQE